MKCRLCLKNSELRESHVVPQFIINWIKKTSATGYLREVDDPNLRKQDCLKLKMLCPTCETFLSVLETNFARSIFYPLQKKEFSKTINYGPWLKRFIVSLNWRIVVAFRWEDLSSGELSLLYDVAEDWRKYLIGEIIDIKSEHHLILLGPLKNSLVLGLPSNFLLHLRRNIDANIFNINNKLVVYTKLPSLIIASFIKPREPKNWENTKIYEKGVIIVPQRVVDDGILKYILVERARLVEEIKISQKQEKVVTKALLQDIERWIKSSSFDAFLADSELRGFKPDKTVFNRRCFCGSGKQYLDCCLLKKLKEIKKF